MKMFNAHYLIASYLSSKKVDYFIEMVSLFKDMFLIAMLINSEDLPMEVKPSQLYKVKLIKSIVWKSKLKYLD